MMLRYLILMLPIRFGRKSGCTIRFRRTSPRGGGAVLPVESRMLNSIAKVTSASAMRLEDLSPSRPRNWADTTLADRADAVGLGDAYLGSFGGASAAVHGSWMDLLEFH